MEEQGATRRLGWVSDCWIELGVGCKSGGEPPHSKREQSFGTGKQLRTRHVYFRHT
jgi:hypothetical protein